MRRFLRGRQVADRASPVELPPVRQGNIGCVTTVSATPAIIKRSYGFNGEVVIVTGAARGIGEGIADVLAEAGATVIVADLNGEKAQERASALRKAGHLADYVQLDIADEASIVFAHSQVVAKHGAPWGLVNNAGLLDRQMLLDATAQEWDRVNAVNSRGVFLLMRESARAMTEAKTGGRIVNIASAALIGSLCYGHTIYAASKAALLGLMRAAAFELADHKITVNTILAGGVATPGAIESRGPAPDGPARRPPPLGMCTPRDIGWAVLFFVSPLSGAITNQSIAVDGGWSVT
jgi:NAD(P)-dependent dehydrogenase (short-subunit alcohol dehydrogenase family)